MAFKLGFYYFKLKNIGFMSEYQKQSRKTKITTITLCIKIHICNYFFAFWNNKAIDSIVIVI